jgi:hypothetical protein
MSDPILKILLTYYEEDSKVTKEIDFDLDFKKLEAFTDFFPLISSQLNIKITSHKHSLKILYEESWVNLIDLKSFYFFVSNNLVLNQQTKLLVNKKMMEEQKEMYFSLQGVKFSSDGVIDSNRPNMKIYESSSNPEVPCIFCGCKSKDEYMLQKLGPFYGPVKKGAKKYFFHELCAIWTSDIYMDENNKLKNVTKEIKRTRQLSCTFCGERGAGLGCQACKASYHYLCARSDLCYINKQKFSMYCKYHKDQIKDEDEDFFITKDMEPEGWSDDLCMECKSGYDEDKILICDGCGNGIHTYCNVPEILEINHDENHKFYCYKCLSLVSQAATINLNADLKMIED